MSDLVPASEPSGSLAGVPTDELKKRLADGLGGWAKQLLYLSQLWAELESRGENLENVRSGIGVYLPAIATGAVLPEIVIRFAGQPKILNAVTLLKVSEQQKILDTGRVPVSVPNNGSYSTRMLPVHGLTSSQTTQVFDTKRRVIRTHDEQIGLITPSAWTPRRRKVSRGRVVCDRGAGTVAIGSGQSVPAEEVIEALKAAGMIPQ